jgi:hypothetical protein
MASKAEEAGELEKRSSPPMDVTPIDDVPLDSLPKSRWERSWPVIACGAGLFSDGYLNGVSVFLVVKKREGTS